MLLNDFDRFMLTTINWTDRVPKIKYKWKYVESAVEIFACHVHILGS